METDFTHLHVHTDASPDGLMNSEHLVAHAAELGFTHLAMTDHGTLTNAVSFWAHTSRYNIIPILGLEGYFVYNGKRHHITLNSVNEEGFTTLINLNNWSHNEGWASGYPTFGMEQLNTFNKGLVVATGCPASPLHHGTLAEGLQYVGELVDIFGTDRVFAEEMFVMDEDFVARPQAAAKRFGLKTIVTNDVHFPKSGQGEIHRIMTSCRKGYDYSSDSLYLKTRRELLQAGSSWADERTLNEWIDNTNIIREMIEPFSMRSAPMLPTEEGSSETLYALIQKSLVENFGNPEGWAERIEKEWQVLSDKGFVDYFYILNDIIHFAKSNHIAIGPGRGSAGGSLILYVLGITDIDPMEHGLLFERFLNTHRNEYPDVDVDFESERRQEVIDYAHERWGAFPIATYSTYSHSSLVRDLGRVLKIEKPLTAKASERGPESPAFESFAAANPLVMPSYDAMLGQIRHRGKHPGGVVITPRAFPIERAGDHLVAAWTEGGEKELSLTGIVKYDFLGLTALTQLKHMRELSGVKPTRPVDDDPVFSIFQNGDVGGIFQWTGSDGIRELTKRIKPRTWADLSAINALYRPGPLDSGMADKYPEYMVRPNKHHPKIDPILEDTYGVIVFQEQVMMIVAEMMGGGYETADMARRTIIKYKHDDPKSAKEVEKLRREFFKASSKAGYEKEVIETIWSEIVTFARYGFNKAHSVGYSLIAWEMAWYKYHYPVAFFASLLRSDPTNAQRWLFEAVDSGIKIVTPDINTSGKNYEMDGDTIYLPLSAIKYFGDKGVDAVIESRERDGKFESFADLDKRIPKRALNSRVRKFMMNMGSFSSLAGDPSDLISDYAELPIITSYEAQVEALGFVLPNKSHISFIKTNSVRDNQVAGFISEISLRQKPKGPINVYYLIPSGVFWTRKERYTEKLKVGDLIAVEKASWGDALSVKRKEL